MNENGVDEKNSGFCAEGSPVACFIFEWTELIAQSLIFVVFMLAFVFRIFTVQGNSMLNTLHQGDKVFVWKYDYKPTNGDVVVIKKYGELDETIVKRIIATEGQALHIDFDAGSVFVDGKQLNEYYIKEKMTTQGDMEIPAVVPQGYCFVMGDNRNHSTDSRWKLIGLVKNEYVIGVAKAIYFPFYRIRALKRATP